MLWVGLGFLGAAFLVQVFGRSIKEKLGAVFLLFYLGAVFFTICVYLFLTYFQYISWVNSSSITKYFLPPYKNLAYLFQFYFFRFLIYYGISFLASLSFLVLTLTGNKRFSGKFFEAGEPFIAAFAIFILGNKEWNYAWIYYLVLVLVCYLAIHFYFKFKGSKNERASIYWLWLPLAFSIIILRSFL